MQFPFSYWKNSMHDQLVAYYAFQDNGKLGRDSLERFHFNNNGTQVNGKVGKGVELQGTTITLNGPSQSEPFNLADKWTLAFWMKAENIWEGTMDDIIMKKGFPSGGWTLDINESVQSFIWRLNTLAETEMVSMTSSQKIYPVNTWCFVVMTYEWDGVSEQSRAQIILNAEPPDEMRTESTQVWSQRADYNVANFDVDGALMTTSFIVDEIGVWHRVLTYEEIVWLYNGGVGRTYPFN
jgi:hypothetical protein